MSHFCLLWPATLPLATAYVAVPFPKIFEELPNCSDCARYARATLWLVTAYVALPLLGVQPIVNLLNQGF
jgi:hypothetical protein